MSQNLKCALGKFKLSSSHLAFSLKIIVNQPTIVETLSVFSCKFFDCKYKHIFHEYLKSLKYIIIFWTHNDIFKCKNYSSYSITNRKITYNNSNQNIKYLLSNICLDKSYNIGWQAIFFVIVCNDFMLLNLYLTHPLQLPKQHFYTAEG